MTSWYWRDAPWASVLAMSDQEVAREVKGENGGELMTIAIGQKAPEFCVGTTKNLDILDHKAKLTDYNGKWLILFFYPMDFTFVCPTEIRGFNSRLSEFTELGAEVLGVSTDSVFCHRAWIKTPVAEGGLGGLSYPLGADVTKQVSRDYGVLIEEKGVALRGLFIIDPEGILRYQVICDLNVGRSIDETLRVLQALQSGGMCPLEWHPGDQTL